MVTFDEIKEKVKEKVEKGEERELREEYIYDRKEKAKIAKEKIGKFMEKNAGFIIGFAPILASGLLTILDSAVSNRAKQDDPCTVEDDITGLDFKTKRPLTNDEILELGDRMINGDSKGSALNDMGLLKKEKRRR